ncbi:MAG: polysaccharide deacetylase [Synergistaceae bacterium]|jgi:peptidoglycan/xylan/chitin deacetylase (PgdA/CDA1 family)|nr:polysaccharide deacetylase [Synergistaceae bacterium]
MNTAQYRWPNGKKVGVIVSIDFDGEVPYLWRTRKSPPVGIGDLEQRRFGPRQGIYRMLELFKLWEIRASFFIPGLIADKYPNAVEKIAEGGHEIGLHGYRHERVDEIDAAEMEETLQRARASIERIAGQRDMGYRSPSWEMTDYAFQVLHRLDVLYDSSLMGSDHPYWAEGFPEIPVQWLLDDAIFYRYSGPPSSPRNPGDVVDLWRREFEGLKRWNGLFLVTMHPWISGRASRLQAVEVLIEQMKQDPDVWWTTCGEVADYHRKTYADEFHEKVSYDIE